MVSSPTRVPHVSTHVRLLINTASAVCPASSRSFCYSQSFTFECVSVHFHLCKTLCEQCDCYVVGKTGDYCTCGEAQLRNALYMTFHKGGQRTDPYWMHAIISYDSLSLPLSYTNVRFERQLIMTSSTILKTSFVRRVLRIFSRSAELKAFFASIFFVTAPPWLIGFGV